MKIKRGLAIVLSSVMVLQMSVIAFATDVDCFVPGEDGFEAGGGTATYTAEDNDGDTTTYTYQATPEAGYGFAGWSDNIEAGGHNVHILNEDNPYVTTDNTTIVGAFFLPSGGSSSSSSGSSESSSKSEPEEAPSNSDPEPQQEEEPSEPPALPVSIISTSAGNTLPTAGLGTAAVATKSVSLNLYEMTPTQYVNFVVSTIDSTPAGGEAIIDLNTTACLTTKMVQSILSRNDVTVNIVYIENGVRKLIRIPAGSDLSSLLDANGFIGFTALANAFGATEIVQ